MVSTILNPISFFYLAHLKIAWISNNLLGSTIFNSSRVLLAYAEDYIHNSFQEFQSLNLHQHLTNNCTVAEKLDMPHCKVLFWLKNWNIWQNYSAATSTSKVCLGIKITPDKKKSRPQTSALLLKHFFANILLIIGCLKQVGNHLAKHC